jgi:hypothetical protein
MEHIVFIPAAMFCLVAAISWTVVAAIELRERAAARRQLGRLLVAPAAIPETKPKFRPVVIQGGLQTPVASLYSRAKQTSLRSGGGAAALRARSFGG